MRRYARVWRYRLLSSSEAFVPLIFDPRGSPLLTTGTTSAVPLRGGVNFARRLECAPGPGQVMYKELTGDAGLSEDESHGKAPHIQYRIQAAGGAGVSRRESLHGLSRRHDVSRNLIRVWVAKLEAGTYDEDAEEEADIGHLLQRIDALPPDSKLTSLKSVLAELRREGHGQAMVFTQYTDTMDFLRDELGKNSGPGLMCFSGRGGEVPSTDGVWRRIGRDDAKRRFREGKADILLCIDAAAEGLNFQFCGALINYDMPWNPMRVEQRIGRIDRLGQRHDTIRIVNLRYEGTVETDVYRALRSRIGLFESVVGRLQPILARLPRAISQAVLSGEDRERANAVGDIEQQAREAEVRGFDIDVVTEEDLAMPGRPVSPVTMIDLDRIIGSSDLMPPGTDIQPMGRREYGLLAPGMTERLRVTTDPEYFEEHAESLELWSPGNPVFNPPEFLATSDELPPGGTLRDLLDI